VRSDAIIEPGLGASPRSRPTGTSSFESMLLKGNLFSIARHETRV